MRSLAADPRGYTVWLRASSLASHLAVAAGPPSEALERALDTLTRQRWPQVAETRGAASSVLGLRVREGRRGAMKLPTQLPGSRPLNGTPDGQSGPARPSPKVADSPPLGPRKNNTEINDAVDAALRAQRALTEVDQTLAKDVLATPSVDALTRGAVAL